MPAEVLLKRKKRQKGVDGWEVVRARGHLDEVLELKSSAGTGKDKAKGEFRGHEWAVRLVESCSSST